MREAEVVKVVEIGGAKIRVRVFHVFGTPIVNTTPHEIVFRFNNEDIVVPPGDIIITARPVEKIVREIDGIQFVRTTFVADPETAEIVREIGEKTGAVIVGSIIAAQAFKGVVVGMTPAPGFERVPPTEKRMNPRKFILF